MNLSYNYVVLNSYCKLTKLPDKDSYIDICVRDLYNVEGIKVVNLPLPDSNDLIRYLFALHNSERVNKYIKLPLKRLWYPYHYKNDFSNDKPLCFVLIETRLPEDYLSFLKRNYPNCKIVALHRDFIHLTIGLKLSPLFDIEMTYDEGEAKKYDFPLFSEFESKVDIKIEREPESDVFFAGKAKDRLPALMKAYQRFTEAGLKVYYFLTSVPEEQQVPKPGVEYASRIMSYKEMLYHTVNTKCVLEIVQGGGQIGYTSRFLESVIYGKKMITNCESVKESKFYDPQKIQLVSDMNDIDVKFIKEGNAFVSYDYKNEFSPLRVIERIEEELQKNTSRNHNSRENEICRGCKDYRITEVFR